MYDPSIPQTGWYPDPADPENSLRLWDGESWTGKTSPRPGQSTGSVPARAFGQSVAAPTATTTASTTATMSSPEAAQQTPAWPQAASPQSSATYGPPAYDASGYDASAYGRPGYDAPKYPYPVPPYNPTSKPTASLINRILVVAAIVVGVLFTAGILLAVAIPTFITVKDAASGNAWFNGGVPGWPTVNATGMNFSGGAVVEAWEVQGAKFGGPGPYLNVVRLSRQVPAGETARQYLSNVAEQLEASGEDADLNVLTNGSPAAEWTNTDGFAVGTSDYYLYAKDGSRLYMVYLEASTQDFPKALSIAKPVMFNFKGTN